jgi:hypothetical protein
MWPDGSVGKIGVTYQKLKQRFRKYKNQNLSNWEILEEHNCKFKVSDREIELQKEYGYKVDKRPYWKTIKMPTKEGMSKGGKTAGAIYGPLSVKNGHMKRMQEKAHVARRKAILQYDLDGNLIKEWECGRYASIELNLHATSITAVCKGRLKKTGGYTFKYKE